MMSVSKMRTHLRDSCVRAGEGDLRPLLHHPSPLPLPPRPLAPFPSRPAQVQNLLFPWLAFGRMTCVACRPDAQGKQGQGAAAHLRSRDSDDGTQRLSSRSTHQGGRRREGRRSIGLPGGVCDVMRRVGWAGPMRLDEGSACGSTCTAYSRLSPWSP